MSLLPLSNTLQSLGTEPGMDGATVKSAVQEKRGDVDEKKESFTAPRKKGLGRGLRTLQSILEGNAGTQVTSMERSAEANEVSSSRETKKSFGCWIGRGLASLHKG